MTLLQQYNTMLQKHNDFIQSMMGIAYERHDKEMQSVIEQHVRALRGILDEPVTEPKPRIIDNFNGMYNPNDLDRENNPSLHNGY